MELNLGTILVGAALLAVVGLVVGHLVRQKKRSPCGCNCAHCAMNGACHR